MSRQSLRRETQDRWRHARDNGTLARPALTITRATSEDCDSYTTALIALDEAGFRYTADDAYPAGATLRMLTFENGAVSGGTDRVIPANVYIDAAQHVRHVWLPTLEEVLDEIYRRGGPNTEVLFEQAWFPGHGPGTEHPLPIFEAGPWTATIKDLTYGHGETARAAATAALADLIRMTCPHCAAVSEGRVIHEHGCQEVTE